VGLAARISVLIALVITTVASAQSGGYAPSQAGAYDSRFTFLRLWYDSGFAFGLRGGNTWNHDYPARRAKPGEDWLLLLAGEGPLSELTEGHLSLHRVLLDRSRVRDRY
jgi:hypothetical protein